MHRSTSTDVSTINMAVRVITCAYDKYGMHGPNQVIIEPVSNHMGADAVGKLRKGVSYDDALQQGL